MTFVGRAPCTFANIRWIPPQASADLAQTLRRHNIYVTASRKDACSNSLIEALCCGLPAVAPNDGGSPELIGAGGVLFDRAEEVPGRIDAVVRDYAAFRRNLPHFDIAASARDYIDFGRAIRAGGIEREAARGDRAANLDDGYRRLRRVFLVNDVIVRIRRKILQRVRRA
jgi:glycosyltransferase involved in cell wall biosynthesis